MASITEQDFSIITPSLNAIEYLKLCHASISDQQDITTEHIVIDGESEDNSQTWLASQPNISWVSEKDNSMYEAINKGLRMATGTYRAYLNCDEQYLPGILKKVKDLFEANPDIDIVYGDMLIIATDGTAISYRKSYPLRWQYIMASHLYVPPSSLFWRKKVQDAGLFFPTNYKTRGDAEYVINMLKAGYKSKHLKDYMSVFTMRDDNLGNSDLAVNENIRALQGAPHGIRFWRHYLNIQRRVVKLLYGAYCQRFPLSYSIYSDGNTKKRKDLVCKQASFRWKY